ncbi:MULTISPECIES: peroxiredoxin [unclassified Thermotoga]|uniref:peroxiredoxin n=1 Tax=unclassified Thermotoga TaxID=2631113 RepID=UPI000280E914|nr:MULTISPECIES: peroxiredoxin [unclassified Thermotoga]AIY85700.1 alkyl hydroperoxide reductase/ Thiol specific antioxidant/ Mal allergen [Thermotoga sp. 2812B]EJX26491.1 alkyl hydroperoxide reductase/ Thiol specific antioxidant/ Mal allergen [Thermotoga sp. EMP]
MLKSGDRAIDFELVNTDLKMVKLSDFSGKNVVLAFYPGAFTSVCEKELCTFRDSLSKFNRLNAMVLGISVDSPFANKAFAEKNHITFDLLSDFGGRVASQYGGVHENFLNIPGYTAAKRAVYVVDGSGTIVYSWVSEDPGKEPPYEEIEEALERLSK